MKRSGTIRELVHKKMAESWLEYKPFVDKAVAVLSDAVSSPHFATVTLRCRAQILREAASKLDSMADNTVSHYKWNLSSPEGFIAHLGLQLRVYTEFEKDQYARVHNAPKVKHYVVEAYAPEDGGWGKCVASVTHKDYKAGLQELTEQLLSSGHTSIVEGVQVVEGF